VLHWPQALSRLTLPMSETPLCPDPRQELTEILGLASAYLNWMKEDGVSQIEISRTVVMPVEEPVKPMKKTKSIEPAASAVARIAAEINVCTRCTLHKTRTKTVPGQGNTQRPEVMFVGEAPGADEDKQGLAFVGRAGQLLTKMIEAMGFQREEVFIANILKCRPPDNRPPTPEEMAICIPYLKRQIAEIQPKVIVALGATAVLGLLNLTGISKLRGTWLAFEGIELMPTYHPAYLLRNPAAKKEVWADLQAVLKRLGRTPPPAVRK